MLWHAQSVVNNKLINICGKNCVTVPVFCLEVDNYENYALILNPYGYVYSDISICAQITLKQQIYICIL